MKILNELLKNQKILSVLVLSVSLLGLTACNKPAPAVVSTPAPAVQVAPAPVVVTPSVPSQTVTVVETKTVKTVVAKKATNVAKKATKQHKKSKKVSKKALAEKQAYGVALVNKVVYVCFERLYEKVGPPESSDIAAIDANRMGFAQRCIELGAVDMDDVREFEGKV